MSKDGCYLASGSEDGQLFLWDIISALPISTEQIHARFQGHISSVDWNPVYHMIALSGFGEEFPILVFNWSRTENTEALHYYAKTKEKKLEEQESEEDEEEDTAQVD